MLGEWAVKNDLSIEPGPFPHSYVEDLACLIQTHHPEVFLTLTDFILSTENLAHDRIDVFRTVYGDFLLLA